MSVTQITIQSIHNCMWNCPSRRKPRGETINGWLHHDWSSHGSFRLKAIAWHGHPNSQNLNYRTRHSKLRRNFRNMYSERPTNTSFSGSRSRRVVDPAFYRVAKSSLSEELLEDNKSCAYQKEWWNIAELLHLRRTTKVYRECCELQSLLKERLDKDFTLTFCHFSECIPIEFCGRSIPGFRNDQD
jgi:hypothetical protein